MKKPYTPLFLLLIASMLSTVLHAQENVTTFGIQYKPIIPTRVFNSGFTALSDDNWNIEIGPKFGHNFGMVIRRGLSKRWSVESGINFVTRNFQVDASYNDTTFTDTDFKLIAYEIPIKGLVYIQLGDRLFLNTALGFSIDMYPSDIVTADVHFDHFTARRNWVQSGLIGNFGVELRTKEKGYFYLGGTLHRPFTELASTHLTYHRLPNTIDSRVSLNLKGSYFTVDLRYFFHEEAVKRKKKS